ncbi:MAG: response regulator [Verrucomicrobia bacterium]|nr:response regulator [Verrucomicrobiota bacterium]
MTNTILIVDDEPHMLRITELSLKKAGFNLLIARSGNEALQLARQHLPALIVMDVVMPDLDGISALKELKAAPATAKIPVIMLTSRGQNVTRVDAEGSGAALYLTKPFSPSALAAEARRIIEAAAAAEPNPPAASA